MLRSKKAETTLYAELIRRGLPADYAQRTAEEIDDHRYDLLAELRQANTADPYAIVDERLGETRQLAEEISRDYRRRSWLGRWSLLSFVILPPAVLTAGWFGTVLLLLGIGRVCTWFGGSPGEVWSPVNHAVMSWVFALGLFAFVVPAGIAWLYGRTALRVTQSRAFVLAACLGIGILNSIPQHDYRIDPANPELAMNLVSVPFCDPTDPDSFLACVRQWAKPVAACQLITPVLAGAIVVLLDERRRRALLASAPEGTSLRTAA